MRVMHVQHQQGPIDGSLYARVSKSRREQQQQRQESSSYEAHRDHHTAHQRSLSDGGGFVSVTEPTSGSVNYDSGIVSNTGNKSSLATILHVNDYCRYVLAKSHRVIREIFLHRELETIFLNDRDN